MTYRIGDNPANCPSRHDRGPDYRLDPDIALDLDPIDAALLKELGESARSLETYVEDELKSHFEDYEITAWEWEPRIEEGRIVITARATDYRRLPGFDENAADAWRRGEL